jgi:hypothetical protein
MANMEAEDLLKYITSIGFGDGMWKGTANGFFLNWQDKVRQYKSILPVKDLSLPQSSATCWRMPLEMSQNFVQSRVKLLITRPIAV